MTTSLASQLAGIRSHHAERLSSSGALTMRDSYLFTPRVAAEQDHLTVHALGVTGWEQLTEEDGVLAAWPHGELLFGDQSVKMDRATLSKQANADIDVAVRELLYLMGPVLLSRSAAKCLEWLVRRFRIHEYTPHDLLHAFFPYHLTPQFARILQLVPVDKHAEMRFLVPVKKSQAPLPTSVLIQAMGSNLDVLRWVASARAPTSSVAGTRRMHVPFWTSILVQFCLFRRTNKRSRASDAQAMLAFLVPEILHVAQGATQDQETAVGAMMVLCSLGVAFPLRAKAVRGVLDAMVPLATSATPSVARAMVAACMSLCSSPDDVADPFETSQRLLSDTMVHALVMLPELVPQVVRAWETHDVEPFMAQLLGALVAQASSDAAQSVLERLLDQATLPAPLARRTYVSLLRRPTAPEAWDARVRLLARLRERHPATLDEALALARQTHEEQAWQVMRAVLHMQATGTVPDDAPQDAALWLGVHSADVHAQHMSLEHLLQAVDQGEIRAHDSLVRDAIHAAVTRAHVPLVETLYAHAPTLLAAMEPGALLDMAVTRMQAASVSAEERHLHVAFVTQHLLPRAPELGERVWRDMLWPELMPRPGACTDALAALQHVDVPPMARAVVHATLHASPREPVAWTLRVAQAIVTYLVSCDEATLLREADGLCDTTATNPISYGGALALLVLSQLLAQDVAPRVWIALAYRATMIVHTQQLLAGQVDDVMVGHHVDEALVQPVLSKLSRQSVRLLGVQVLYMVLQHLPTNVDASLMMAVQQRTTPLAQLMLHVYQTLHAPGVGKIASTKLVPVLFERMGWHALALLAGVWTSPGGHDMRHAATSLASLVTALDRGSVVPRSDVSVRLMAMRHAALLVTAATQHRRALDVQTLLPSLLVVLQDSVPVLRDAAAQLLCALDAWNAASEPGAPREVYGLEQVYGQHSAALQYLDTPTYVKYTSLLAKDAGAFINDAAFLAATHTAMLRGTGKKETLFRSKVLCYLLSHAVCTQDVHMRMALLGIVRDVHAPCKLTTVLPLIQEAVDGHVQDPMYLPLLYETYDASADLDRTSFAYLERSLRGSVHLQQAALGTLHGLYPALSMEHKQAVFLAMAETLADPHTPSVAGASAALRSLPVSDAVLVSVLRSLCESLEEEDEAPKRARTHSTRDEQVRHAAVVLITVLESMQSRTLGMEAALVAALFDVVRTAISLHATHLFNAEYVLQLAMQSLCDMFDHITVLPVDVAQVIRADTIVNAIKVSTNTQSINHAILLLARFARLDAELVLHNIMPIFTFVGLNVLQRDDRFTLSVVEQTLRSIIPAFVKAVRPQVINDKDALLALWCETRSLLRIFSDASTHIPRHRRHVFFRLLVDVLGADDFLAPVCMLLADRVTHRVTRSPGSSSSLLQLPLGIMRAEPFHVRVHAMNQMWSEVVRLLHDSDDVFLVPTPRREYSDEHLSTMHQAHTLLLFLHDAMTQTPADEASEELAQYAWYTLCVLPEEEALQAALHKARTPVFQRLPTSTFLTLVLHLLHGTREAPPGLQGTVPLRVDMPRTALDLLASRAVRTDRAAHVALFEELHKALVHVYETHPSLGADALDLLHTSITHSASSEHAGLTQLMPPLWAHAPPQPQVLHVLTAILLHVGVRALSHLSVLVPYACEAAETGSDDDVHSAALLLLAALFKTLSQFMHGYVARVMRLLVSKDTAHVRSAARKVQDAMIKRMPPATILEAWGVVWRETPASATSLLHMLQWTVRHMDKAAVAAHYKTVFRFVLQAMDLQRKASAPSRGVLPAVERAVHVFVALSLKLSETQFRPLFLRTYDWAVVDLLEEDAQGMEARSLALYTLVQMLFEQLHAMMVPFYAVVIEHVIEVLQQATRTPLWYEVVRSVRVCAEADEGVFWNASRATPCIAPLVAAMCEEDAALIPDTLLALAQAVPDDEFLRALNTALMAAAHTEHVPTQVRTLHTCASLWAAHGMALLAFVPETVASLSELLDNADPRTSKAALELRVHMEEALGEPLDSYLDSM